MNIKLKLALLRQSSEKGAILPLTIGIGLIMTISGMTMIIRSSDEQLTAQAQKATASSSSAAEAGITRIQSMLNENRALATKNMKNITGVKGESTWANADSWFRDEFCKDQKTSSYVSSGWITLGSNDRDGQFRVVNYTYPTLKPDKIFPLDKDAKNGEVIGIGTLEVEGRVNATGSGNVPGVPLTALEVEIPIRKAAAEGLPVPGMWMNKGNLVNRRIEGDLVYSGGCDVTKAGGVITGEAKPAPYLKLPELPPLPTTIANGVSKVLTSQDQANPIGANLSASVTSTQTIPRSGDYYHQRTMPSGEIVREYPYKVSSVDLTGGAVLTVTPGKIGGFRKRVIIYTDNFLSVQGTSSRIDHNCDGVAGCNPTDLQMFVYGARDSTPARREPGTVCLGGGGISDLFLLAPKSIFAANGSISFRGSLWVDEVNAYSNCTYASSSGTVVQQNAIWEELSSALRPQGSPPNISPISKWERKEAI